MKTSFELKPASKFAGYKIEGLVGKGASSEVFSAIKGKKRYALKILKLPPKSPPSIRKRFIREAEILKKFKHPGLVKVHKTGEQEGLTYLVMDFISGGTFSQILQNRSLTKKQSAKIVLDATHPLEYLHENGIVHRDFKPSNILLTKQGEVVLGDCGLARSTMTGGTLTLNNQIVGTPWYMSFEQATCQKVDKKSDIASVGTVLFEVFTGRHPYFRNKHHIDFGDMMSVEPSFGVKEKLFLPRQLRQFLLQCIHRNQNLRPQSCEKIRTEIGKFLE